MAYDPTMASRREYLHLLVNRGDVDLLLRECVALIGEEELISDTTFWETIRNAFELRQWWYTGDWDTLEELVRVGKQYCASPIEFVVSYAVFLYSQGRMAQGRAHLSDVLGEVGTPEEFLWAYTVAIEAEDQLVDFFALSEEVRRMDGPTLERAAQSIFGSPDPLAPMRALEDSFPSKLVQVQLFNNPLNASLWLKRIELLRESLLTRGGDAAAVVTVYKQAIAQCATGMQRVGVVVGELFEGLAREHLRRGALQAALDTLTEGAWNVHFFSPTVNVMLLGLYAEVRLMTDDTPQRLVDGLLGKLTEAPQTSARRARGTLFLDRPPLAHMQQEPRAWLLVFDLMRCYAADELTRFCDTFSQSGACTPEAVVYVAHTLYEMGRVGDATNWMDHHLARLIGNPLGSFFLLSQYVSLLLSEQREQIDLHRFRELCNKAESLAPAAIQVDPVPVTEFYFACAALETRVGLHGRAVALLQFVATLVTSQLAFHPNAALVLGVVERSIDYTHQYKGIRDVRVWCRRLMSLLRAPEGVQRVALHWAALEKRMGHQTEAHAVFSACASTQSPFTPSGTRFWECWKKLSDTVNEFEQVTRREEQVKTQFQQP
ncbi:pre-mRNA-splicing factor SYF1 [Strigomonas culicis]|uniref:Pre-mRNA-splicing factor SYF1 n=1 Tax=Strigomonas culicis TaxID=28005 RepID=S9VVY4_9TRYP|nr:pre-mRNA-splicing factor SYF1 [Strigomonas culicis]|eukprot:EPY27645.1 pre-mRNA-splicing factor SYF1 [Strigomonas culicis]